MMWTAIAFAWMVGFDSCIRRGDFLSPWLQDAWFGRGAGKKRDSDQKEEMRNECLECQLVRTGVPVFLCTSFFIFLGACTSRE